jgi:RNA-directed DNA polymerase
MGRLCLPIIDCMDFKVYSTRFEQGAKEAGYSASQIVKCLEYSKGLYEKNLPVIYNSDHLSVLVGYSKSYIKRAVAFPQSFYRQFYIRKKQGGRRRLSEPLPSLKEIQRWILVNLLYKIGTHPYAKAYTIGATIKDNVKYHKKKPVVMSLDIKDFFGSISFVTVENIFKKSGYTPIISNLLTKLVTLNGSLAQGAPTSPYISNIVLKEFDSKIELYSKQHKLMFTRYADDLTFSGTQIDADGIKNIVAAELQKVGLYLNPDKTKLMFRKDRQIVTGLVVNVKPQIIRKERKFIRQQVYYIRKFGLTEHIRVRKIHNGNYLLHLIGKINYSLFINPSDKEMIDHKNFLHSLLSPV